MINIFLKDDGGEADRLGVPYTSRDGSYGPVEYFDLKKSPERILDIPYFEGFSRPVQFLKSVNSHECFFRTVRCEKPCKSISATGNFGSILRILEELLNEENEFLQAYVAESRATLSDFKSIDNDASIV